MSDIARTWMRSSGAKIKYLASLIIVKHGDYQFGKLLEGLVFRR